MYALAIHIIHILLYLWKEIVLFVCLQSAFSIPHFLWQVLMFKDGGLDEFC